MYGWLRGWLRCRLLGTHTRPIGYTRCRYCKRWLY